MRQGLKRIGNQLRCWGSYALSMTGRQVVRHMPTFVSVEPANFCQLRCPQCPVGMRGNEVTGERAKGVMPMDTFKRILEQIAPYAHTLQLFWQGEPLLCDTLPEMVSLAHEAGLYTIVSTNAQRLDEAMARALTAAGLNRIIISMDGWTQSSYEQYRQGGNVDKVKEAIRTLRNVKDQTRACTVIELQCLYLRSNEHEWDLFRREYKTLGADRLTMKTAQFYDYEQGSPLMPSDSRYARYRRDAQGRYAVKHPLVNRCYRLWSGCVIDIHGDVMPCCYDKSKQHVLGNILRQPLRAIWQGEQAQAFRRAVLTHRAAIEMCTNCE